MANSLDRMFTDFSAQKLRQQAQRIDTCLAKLTPDQIWARGSENENAVGNLVLHLCGNVRQWIISGVGGAPDVRERDAEFAARGGASAADLSARLRSTVEEAVGVLEKVSAARLAEQILVQNNDLPVLAVIYQVVEHFSAHTGQIIFATKMLTSEDLGFYRHLSKRTP